MTTTFALEQRVFAQASVAVAEAIAAIGDEQWMIEVPHELRWRTGIRTLRDLAALHACDDAWLPDVVTGRTIDEVGARHDGDLLGDDPRARVAGLAEAAVAAVARADDPARIVHLSYGDSTLVEYLLHATIFRGLGAYDIRRLVGDEGGFPGELADDLITLIEPHADELRAMGAFGPAIAVPADASPQVRLLGLAGRAASR